MVLKTEKYICSFDIEMYLVGSWFSTEKSIYINRGVNGKSKSNAHIKHIPAVVLQCYFYTKSLFSINK